MATGTIPSNYKVATGTITKHSSITSGTLDNTTCYKIGDVVTVSARIHSMNNATATGPFFVVPDGFRPKYPTRVSGYMNVNGVGSVPLLATITSDGRVDIGYSASSTCTQVGFAGSFAVTT